MESSVPLVVPQQCSRCGSKDHGTATCTKPFMRPLCSHCNRLGHLAGDCVVKRRQERESACQQREADMQKKRCHYCNEVGHLARQCPRRADDAVSVSSASTAATRTDVVEKAQAPLKCTFCGAKRTEQKAKKGVNMCRDRCQSCFRPFKGQGA
jgi:hypothetical protein